MIIVPYGAGGGVSINARALAPYLEKTLGTRVLVENREGAGGITGHTAGAMAKPDGYTLTMVSPAICASPWLVPNVRFTPESFAYIGQVSFVPNMLVVSADSKFQTLKDLVDAMRAAPDTISTGMEAGWPSSTVADAGVSGGRQGESEGGAGLQGRRGKDRRRAGRPSRFLCQQHAGGDAALRGEADPRPASNLPARYPAALHLASTFHSSRRRSCTSCSMAAVSAVRS